MSYYPNTSLSFFSLHAGEGPGDFRDYQEVKVQEQVQTLEVGKVSTTIAATPTDYITLVTLRVPVSFSLTNCPDSTQHVGDSGE